MKIAFIVPHFPPHIGGGEQLYFDVCKGLVLRGHNVRVVTSSSGGVSGFMNLDGIDVWYCNWKLVFGHPIVRMRDIEEHVRWCDIVHTAIYSTALKSISASDKTHRPCVVTLHEVMGDKWSFFEVNPLKAAAFRFYENLILKRAQNVHVVSESTRRDYEKYCHDPGRVFMIYNFLNLPADESVRSENITFKKTFGLKEDERGILYFGRPAANKGIFVLIEAIRLLRDHLAGKNIFFCLILSRDPQKGRQKVLKLIDSYGLTEYVRIIDSLPRGRLLKVLSEADLCVIPSVTEGFGYAACEACYYKRPVISSDGGSLREVVSGRAVFFENRNSNDLKDKLFDYIENGTDHFENIPEKVFDKDRIIDSYISMYDTLLGNNGEERTCM